MNDRDLLTEADSLIIQVVFCDCRYEVALYGASIHAAIRVSICHTPRY